MSGDQAGVHEDNYLNEMQIVNTAIMTAVKHLLLGADDPEGSVMVPLHAVLVHEQEGAVHETGA